jgi:radical SAM protein with 4Fe4S-binding SPASM domain
VDCVHLPVRGLDELNQRLRRVPAPLSGGIEVTQRCNLRCVHCYCRQDATELSLETICHIVDQAAEAGVFSLMLTGGEPLLRKDFLDIYDHVKSRGILPILLTNGTLITPRIADHLAEYPPLVVEISTYGMTRETYESITGVPGSHERCLRGIHELMDRGIRVFFKTPAMIQNRHELDDLAKFAESLGTRFRFDAALVPRLHGMDDRYGPYDYSLPLSDRVDIEFADEAKVEAWEALAERSAATPRPDTVYTCGAGRHGFFVDARGHMTMCVMSRHPSCDLTKCTFKEGWDLLRRTRQEARSEDASPECGTCDLVGLCVQCPARAQLEYGPGAVSRRVEWACELAHMRAERLRTLKGVEV